MKLVVPVVRGRTVVRVPAVAPEVPVVAAATAAVVAAATVVLPVAAAASAARPVAAVVATVVLPAAVSAGRRAVLPAVHRAATIVAVVAGSPIAIAIRGVMTMVAAAAVAVVAVTTAATIGEGALTRAGLGPRASGLRPQAQISRAAFRLRRRRPSVGVGRSRDPRVERRVLACRSARGERVIATRGDKC